LLWILPANYWWDNQSRRNEFLSNMLHCSSGLHISDKNFGSQSRDSELTKRNFWNSQNGCLFFTEYTCSFSNFFRKKRVPSG
jgi:hypothetical protein